MNHMIPFAVIALTASLSQDAASLCQQLARFAKPQPLFLSHPTKPSLRFEAAVHKAVATPTRAPFGNYYFTATSDGSDTIRLFAGDKEDWLISWPDHPGRPIHPAWINAKLLYLEISVNPRVSVYWIIDVETRSVIVTEIEHDGSQAWNQCFPDRSTAP